MTSIATGLAPTSVIGTKVRPNSTSQSEHEWSKHISGSNTISCALCMDHVLRLHTALQESTTARTITIQSNQYFGRELLLQLRCSHCLTTSNQSVEELLHMSVDQICQLCAMQRKSNSFSKALPSSIPPSSAVIDLVDISDDSYMSDDEEEKSNSGTRPDFSDVTMLQRVITDATQLKQAFNNSNIRGRSGTKASPILVDESVGSPISLPDHPPSLTHSPISITSTVSTSSTASTVDQQNTTISPGHHSPPPLIHSSVDSHMVHDATILNNVKPKRIQPNLKASLKRRLPVSENSKSSPDEFVENKERRLNLEHKAPSTSTSSGAVSSSSAFSTSPSSPSPCFPRTTPLPPFVPSKASHHRATTATSRPFMYTNPDGSRRRSRTPYEYTSASGSSFAPRDPNNLFSDFVRIDPSDAAKKQQALFEKARQKLDLRRQLNIEPEPLAQKQSLPFQSAAGMNHSSKAEDPASKIPFTLPTFFRSEATQPYTITERQAACQMILSKSSNATSSSASSTVSAQILLLPNSQPTSWANILLPLTLKRQSSSTTSTGAPPPPVHTHYSSPSGILSHHYRRLAKLVHPDKAPNGELRQLSEQAFKALHQAYTQLATLV